MTTLNAPLAVESSGKLTRQEMHLIIYDCVLHGILVAMPNTKMNEELKKVLARNVAIRASTIIEGKQP